MIVEDREPHALGRRAADGIVGGAGERGGSLVVMHLSLMTGGQFGSVRARRCSEERRLDSGRRVGGQFGGDQARPGRVGAELPRAASRASRVASRIAPARGTPVAGSSRGGRSSPYLRSSGRTRAASHAR